MINSNIYYQYIYDQENFKIRYIYISGYIYEYINDLR